MPVSNYTLQVKHFSLCHIVPTHKTKPSKDRKGKKDTSMTATMLLQDSIVKPSVFRSPSETQTKEFLFSFCNIQCFHIHAHILITSIRIFKDSFAEEKATFEFVVMCVKRANTVQQNHLRFPMILLRMFMSSAGLTSMSCENSRVTV